MLLQSFNHSLIVLTWAVAGLPLTGRHIWFGLSKDYPIIVEGSLFFLNIKHICYCIVWSYLLLKLYTLLYFKPISLITMVFGLPWLAAMFGLLNWKDYLVILSSISVFVLGLNSKLWSFFLLVLVVVVVFFYRFSLYSCCLSASD